MSQSPTAFYTDQVNINKGELSKIKKRLFAFGMVRLGLFFLIVGLVYILRDKSNIALVIGFGGLGFFLFLVSRNTDLKNRKRFIEELIALNIGELNSLKGDVSEIEAGEEFISEEHHYNQDIDLFGGGSIFQYINRTRTANGKTFLAHVLNENNIDMIEEKQAVVQELAKKSMWRQSFQTTAALISVKIENTAILNWLKINKPVFSNVFKYLPLTFSVISILFGVLFGLDLIPGALITVWFFVGIGISAAYFKRVSDLYNSAGRMTDTFTQYAKLLEQIEGTDFEAKWLKDQKGKIKLSGRKASQILQQLSKELNSLDQRNNFLFAFIGNGFLLWDIRYSYRIESWMKEYGETVEHWFEAISFFDAYNSLGNYAFNSPSYIYPELNNNGFIIETTGLGHPLLDADKRVSNDLSIRKDDFLIITGANMAGKSTFLRTVALNIVLSNVGLPVCAATFSYTPIKLISSMRTSDSLQNDESYFFSELKRLKFIVDELKNDTFFIILDEILKGTNSKDKEEGSKKFVQKLIGTDSMGMIATHDLSLCQLSNDSDQIKNHYFDAEIVNDELYFDYRFKDGICKNMNASFLLRKMEIV